MVPLIAGLILLWAGSVLLRQFLRATPAALARRMKQGAGFALLCAALFLLVRGRIDLALALGGLGFWLTTGRRTPVWDRFRPGAGRRAGGTSRIRSATIDMVLDHSTGAMGGTVVAGIFAGTPLDALDHDQLAALHAACSTADPEGARLLDAYLDRRMPGWRSAAEGERDPRRGAGSGRTMPGSMSENEAHELLGVAKGASREEIARAHRALMKKFHPDHGGSTDMAARVNEAKDVLMRRHPT